MSTTYIAVIVNILAAVLPHLGISVGSDALTATIQTLVLIGTGIWVLVRRHKQGDVTTLGFKK